MGAPFLDLHAGYAELRTEIDTTIARVLDSGWYMHGPKLATEQAGVVNSCISSFA